VAHGECIGHALGSHLKTIAGEDNGFQRGQ
jgi:hypothetical protein